MVLDKIVDKLVVTLEFGGTQQEELLCLRALLHEQTVHGILVETVDELDEVFIKKVELF